MLSIGHRGAAAYEPENTLLSIHKAIELGADWVEVDVYLIDGQLLVIHDDTLDRTTNGFGKLSSYSFQELRAFDAGKGEKIPTLLEVINTTQGCVGLNIELKGIGSAEAVASLLGELSKERRSQILISSFIMGELKILNECDDMLRIGVLASSDFSASFQYAKELNAISIHFSKEQVSRKLVEQAHESGLLLYVYTVNKKRDVQRMRSLGVDGVYSDFPDLINS